MSVWKRVRIWAISHAVDDFYQGLAPAMVPFFILERDYTYVAASALAMAATLGGSVPQPVFGVVADRSNASWMAPVGLAIAGTAAGLAGAVPTYALVWTLLLASGIGVSLFHPAAGRSARAEAGGSATAMSIFATGGSVGFFLAPALATPLLLQFGVAASAVFIVPALAMAIVLARHQRRSVGRVRIAEERAGRDRWGLFALVTGVGVVRSIVSFGVMTFIAMYWIDHLGASAGLGGAALTCFLVGGVAGTIAGGRIGDRFGAVRATLWGSVAMVPTFVAVRLVDDPYAALGLVVFAGVATNVPFAVLVKLGQDYLPSRPGTAAGITLGLAVSAGGLLVPVLGMLADRQGIGSVLTVLCFVPLVAIVLATFLPAPSRDRVVEPAQ